MTPTLSLILETDKIYCFFPLLQHGVMLQTRIGRSIRDMLCHGFGVSPEYLENRIETIFLNGKPVDDAGSAIVRDGSVLALSAAMPGLVGSTFRKGGHLAAFRSTITHPKEEADVPVYKGVFILKLFNLLVRELGPVFLKRGVWIRKNELEAFLRRQSEIFQAECKAVKKGR